ncbi:hypothetical protein [Pseudomonas sp. B26(2017)]|uniref:hypothetical protein n=1 Tax=Pseudomonas sp. B26(2017) TaxID=1981732 RepID=UPI000A1E79AA|nr:hypothetical protein [Pseudomonas sp. B26(2017)]
MNTNKPIGSQAVQGWRRSRGATAGNLRRPGKRHWIRDATHLLIILLLLPVGYFTAYHFAAHTLRELVNVCTARFEVEFEQAEVEPPLEVLSRSLCECQAKALLKKNGVVRLALVDSHLLAPQSLEPVTEQDAEACINALWKHDAEWTGRLPVVGVFAEGDA